VSVPGIGVVKGRCTATITSVGYTNASGGQQSVVNAVSTGSGGTGGANTAGTVDPERGAVLGVSSPTAEGRIRVAMPGQYMDADVFIARPDDGTCEAWTKITVSPG